MKHLIVLLLSLLLLVTACGVVSPELTPFYDPPDPLPFGEPGEIIKSEKIETNNAAVQAWRVMYHSRDLDGNDTAVTGIVAAPTGDAPEGGFPVLAIAHGTEGLARKCATSLDPWGVPSFAGEFLSFPDTAIVPYVQAGYAVAATDYQGLGAPGTSSYLVGSVEAQNVIDSVRALRSFEGIPLNDQNYIWGHSQGGHSAAFTAQLAHEIAPELNLSGIVLSAPAVELKGLVEDVLYPNQPSPVTGVAAMVAASWNQAYGLPLDTILTTEGIKQLPAVEDECVVGAIAAFITQSPSIFYHADPTMTEPWRDTILLNTPDTTRYPAPVFVAQGGADTLITPRLTEEFVGRLCEAGNAVQFKLYEGADHLGVVKSSTADVVAWLGGLAGGNDAPSDCPNPAPKASTMPTTTPSIPNPQPIADRVILTDGAFTPDAASIQVLESLLPDYLARQQDKFNKLKLPIVERLATYRLQYWGEVQDGKQMIFVNAFCTDIPNWRTQQVLVLDGGDCFFNVLYDPATKTFSHLSVNGEA